MTVQPHEFRELAQSIRLASSAVADDSRLLKVVADSVLERWESPAARSFSTNQVPGSLSSYGVVNRDLDALAAALETAAADLESRLLRVKSIEQDVRAWFARQPPNADGSPPRWETQPWKYRPHHFPPSGDAEWFDVKRYLESIGFTF